MMMSYLYSKLESLLSFNKSFCLSGKNVKNKFKKTF